MHHYNYPPLLPIFHPLSCFVASMTRESSSQAGDVPEPSSWTTRVSCFMSLQRLLPSDSAFRLELKLQSLVSIHAAVVHCIQELYSRHGLLVIILHTLVMSQYRAVGRLENPVACIPGEGRPTSDELSVPFRVLPCRWAPGLRLVFV